jgi:hypothetical protein
MLDAELEVCTDCGVLHMESDDGPAPRDVQECSSCGGRLSDVELDDIVGL